MTEVDPEIRIAVRNRYGIPEELVDEGIAHLALRLKNAEEERQEAATRLSRLVREAEDLIDQALIAKKPAVLVDDELLEHLGLAVEKLRSREPWGDHLGSQIVPGSKVVLSTRESRVNVYARAPRGRRSHQEMWEYSHLDRAAMGEALASTGAVVLSQWVHEDGVAFQLKA